MPPYEEFATVLCQIEACLNSRPLAPMPCDDDGLEALTPGHSHTSSLVAALSSHSLTLHSPTDQSHADLRTLGRMGWLELCQ